MKKIFVIALVAISAQTYAGSYILHEVNADAIETSEKPTDYIYRASQNPEEYSIEFIDLKGNTLIVYPVQLKYDVTSLPDGVYVIQTSDKEGNVLSTKKFMKNS